MPNHRLSYEYPCRTQKLPKNTQLKMDCSQVQVQSGRLCLHFLQLGRVYRTSVSRKISVGPLLGSRGLVLKQKWQGRPLLWQPKSMVDDGYLTSSNGGEKNPDEPDELGTSSFCIIEGPETIQDFAKMQLQEIQDNVRSRRNKIFLFMEEIRRLRVQQRIKSADMRDVNDDDENEMPDISSSIPFVPRLTMTTLKQLYATCFLFIAGIIIFGGLLAPTLELKLGVGGTTYEDFIRNMHLPLQLSQVDPIVASFSGGAVGVISALMVVEVNNVEQQEGKRCKYCHGTGYLACARCHNTGAIVVVDPIARVDGSDRPLQLPTTERCPNCSGAGKVMCPTCLCTGMAMASEHDPRIDPFD